MELKIDHLLETCAACGGTGKLPEKPKKSGGHTYGPIPLSSYTGDPSDCGACGGTGRGALTATGQALVDFIKITKRRGLI